MTARGKYKLPQRESPPRQNYLLNKYRYPDRYNLIKKDRPQGMVWPAKANGQSWQNI